MKMQEALQFIANNPERVFVRMVGNAHKDKIIGWSKDDDQPAYYFIEDLDDIEMDELAEIERCWLTNEWEIVNINELKYMCTNCHGTGRVNEPIDTKNKHNVMPTLALAAVIIILLTAIFTHHRHINYETNPVSQSSIGK